MTAKGQSCCSNLGFENQNFTGWQAYTGFYSNCCPYPGIVSNRHEIITAQGTDYYTCHNLSFIPPGFNQSMRLGNENVGGEAEKISKTICVDSLNPILVYRYAIVLSDPGHNPNDQPKFDFRILDSSGAIVDSTCGFYSVSAQSNLPGFQTCTISNGSITVPIVWRDWTPVGFDLSPYIGQNITVEFSTYDCNLGQHFGYAYFVAECTSADISVSKCLYDSVSTLTAPDGFSYSWYNGATTQSISVLNPDSNFQYSVQLITVTGCQFSLSSTIKPTLFYNEIEILDSCANAFQVLAKDSTLNSSINSYLWNFGDGSGWQIGGALMNYQYNASGTYLIQLAVSSESGCWDTVTRSVNVLDGPNPNFTTQLVCEGDSFSFINTSTGSNSLTYSWMLDNQVFNTVNLDYVFSDTGLFVIQLEVTDTSSGCVNSISQSIMVNPKPQLTFDTLGPYCNNDSWVNLNDYTWSNLFGNPDYAGPGVLGSLFFPENVSAGFHELTFRYQTIYGCEDSIKRIVEIQDSPQILLDTIPIRCENNSELNLMDFIQTNNATLIQFSGSGVVGDLFYPEIAQEGMHSITVYAINEATGCAASDVLLVGVLETPEIDKPDSVSICISDEPFTLPDFFPSGGTYYAEQPIENGQIDPLEWGKGEHWLGYEFTFFENCVVRDSVQIIINESMCLCTYFVPNAFTPNGDLKNDIWRPEFYCFLEYYSLEIYNRWGERIFQTSDPLTGWDGVGLNGESQMAGTYIAKISFVSKPLKKGYEFFPIKEILTQNIQLIR